MGAGKWRRKEDEGRNGNDEERERRVTAFMGFGACIPLSRALPPGINSKVNSNSSMLHVRLLEYWKLEFRLGFLKQKLQ